MIYIAHRINTIEELKKIPANVGVEIDLRDKSNNLILQHDPFKDGENFEEYLKHYNHELMILNIKSERIENRILELLKKYNVTNYFFLDSSFPMIVQLSNQGEKNSALRFSELEGIDTILAMQNRVNWVWIDCFTKLPITQQIAQQLKTAGFKICLVSPELQGRDHEIEAYKSYLKDHAITVDAICTKGYNIARWQSSN